MIGRRPAAFLDRDGVLTEEVGYVTSAAKLRVLPRAIEAVRLLRAKGFAVVVVTNQSAVARGLVSAGGLASIHEDLRRRFLQAGAPLAAVYACPHHPLGEVAEFRSDCACRKPAPGLVLRAARELGLALDGRSFFAGDQLRDLACARAAGVRPVLVRTGKGAKAEAEARALYADVAVHDDLLAVAAAARS